MKMKIKREQGITTFVSSDKPETFESGLFHLVQLLALQTSKSLIVEWRQLDDDDDTIQVSLGSSVLYIDENSSQVLKDIATEYTGDNESPWLELSALIELQVMMLVEDIRDLINNLIYDTKREDFILEI